MNTIQDKPSVCAICGSRLEPKTIDYIDRNDGHFLIVRDVPVVECAENGHQFFHASVAHKIERLFEQDRQHTLTPVEVVEVPVVELSMAG